MTMCQFASFLKYFSIYIWDSQTWQDKTYLYLIYTNAQTYFICSLKLGIIPLFYIPYKA